MDIWTFLEQGAPKSATAVEDLYLWSLSFNPGQSPFTLFLDMVGWTERDGLGDVYSWTHRSLGHAEMALLAAALQQYTDHPQEVYDYIDSLIAAEEGA